MNTKENLGYPAIALVGAAGAGKDTVADILAEEYAAVKYSSGDPIKDVGISHYGMTEWMCYTHEGKASEHPYLKGWFTATDGAREMIALEDSIGTEWAQDNGLVLLPATCREVLEAIGDKMNALDRLSLVRPIKARHEESGLTVVDVSTREESQAEYVRDMGGVVVYLKRPEKEAEAGSHHTATFYEVTDHDYQLDNTEGLDELQSRVHELASSLQRDSAS